MQAKSRSASNAGSAATRKARFTVADAAVSDVLGTVLLVGITVVISAVFGLLILTIDGPSETVRTSITGQLADIAGDPPNDAMLTLKHVGGDQLVDSQTQITLRFPDGSTQTINPTFSGGKLSIGQSWQQVIVLPSSSSGTAEVLVTSTSGSASQVVFTTEATIIVPSFTFFSYVDSGYASVGSVENLAGAKSPMDSDDAASLEEAVTAGGGGGDYTLTPTTSNSVSASNVPNVYTNDDIYATILTPTGWLEGGGVTAPPAGANVDQVTIAFEGNSPVPAGTITHEQTVSVAGDYGLTITSPSITGVATDFYLASIANGDSVKVPVASVAGLGLAWTLVGAECANESSGGCVEVWRGSGTAVTGTVTATFTGLADDAAIAVSRYSGVDLVNPVTDSDTAQGAGQSGTQSWSLPAVTGNANGTLFVALGTHDRQGTTWTNPTNQRASLGVANEVWMAVADGTSTAGSNTASGSLIGGADDWHGVALTIKPLTSTVSTSTLSYSINGVPGTSSRLVSLGQTDQRFVLDVTSDRAWTLGDLQNMSVRVTNGGVATNLVFIDSISVEVTTSNPGTSYGFDSILNFTGVPGGAAQTVELRYRVNTPGDSFAVSVWNGTGWRPCTGLLTSIVFVTYGCPLNLPSEFQSGSPQVKIQDVTPAGANKGTLIVEYLRVATS